MRVLTHNITPANKRMVTMHIYALYAAKPQAFGPRGAPSAIVKSQVSQLTVLDTGTLEDEQGNKKLHGGPEKVLHQYSNIT